MRPRWRAAASPRTLRKARSLAGADGLTILRPARAQNVNAFAVTRDFSAANGISSLSDLARWSQSNAAQPRRSA